ncbi:LemA family protein [Cohnella sp. GCM10027633]|uniref:LemA family protein n=1 Tax=unclassified Cohnella TaxID=2636738 RepID=UPI00362A166F
MELYIGLGIAAIIVIWGIILYNRLVLLRNRARNNWSQIDILLKNRFDLVPNLVDTVSAYMTYEKETLTRLTEMRTKFASVDSAQDKAAINGEMSGVLGRLIAVSENYPDLKASENFLYLKQQLAELEDKVRFGRQFYNDTVEAFNTAVQSVPTNIIASLFGFRELTFYHVDEAEKATPRIKL